MKRLPPLPTTKVSPSTPSDPKSGLSGYAWAVCAVALGWLLRLVLTAWAGEGLPPYMTFYPVVMVAALLGGPGPGMLASALAAGSVATWLLPPVGLGVARPMDLIGLALFIFMSALMTAVAHLYRQSRTKAAAFERQQAVLAAHLQSAQALSASEARYRDVVERAEDGIFISDASGRYLEVNRAGAQMLGYPREAILQMGIADIVCPEEAARIPAELAALANHAVLRSEWRFRRKDQSVFVGEVVGRQLPDGRFQGIVRDVTEHRRLEAELQAERALLASVTRATDVHLAYLDRDFNFVWVNTAYAKAVRQLPEQLVGKNHFALFPHAENESIFRQVRETGEAVFYKDKPFEHPHRPERGISYWDWSLAPTTDLAGKVTGLVLSLRETTPFVQAQLALRRSEERLRMALRAAHMTTFDYVPATDRLYREGYLPDVHQMPREMSGRALLDSLHPDDRSGFVELLEGLTPLYPSCQFEYRLQTFQGTYLWMEIHARAEFDAPRQIVRLVGVSRDISSRKAVEQALAREQALLAQIVGHIPVLLYIIDPSRPRGQLNHHAQEVLGWSDQDVSAPDFLNQLFPDPHCRSVLTGDAQAPQGWRECLTMSQAGTAIPIDWTCLKLANNTMVAIGLDLRSRKAHEAALARQAERQRLLLQVAAQLLPSGRDKAVLAQRIFDCIRPHLDADMALNFKVDRESGGLICVADFGIAPEQRAAVARLRPGQGIGGAVAATGHAIVLDAEQIAHRPVAGLVRSMGLRAYVCHPLVATDGRVQGTLAIGSTQRDSFSAEEVDFLEAISYYLALAWERQAAEQEIQRLNATLEERVQQRTAALTAANQELESFTYAASHDMKGPLGRITNFSTLLGERYRDRLEGEGLLFLDLIRQNATRLQLLVADLLAHAQIGQQTWERTAIDVPAMVKGLLHERADDIRKAGAQIHKNLPEDLKVMSNPLALAQILRNLIDNALKFAGTAQPPIIVVGGQALPDCCRLWVRDNGIGIEPIYQEKIFEIFRRLHTYNEYPGSGVGLALVKKAVDRMEGRVWVESEPGKGATFFVELPKCSAAASTPSVW